MKFPYTYISCPCTDVSVPITRSTEHRVVDDDDDEEQEKTFDPRTPRANFALFPIEHLQYCEDCQQIKCPRCTIEEILCWYCPSCVFEVPSSLVKSEGGRCYRGCHNCPICTAPLAVNSINPDPAQKNGSGPFIMSCGYCNWTTLDIGWQFEKFQNIHHQMAKLKIGGSVKATPTSPSEREMIADSSTAPVADDDHASVFASLRTFYNSQMSAGNPSEPLLTPSGSYNYSSPNSLARIMSLYTGRSFYGKKGQGKPAPMRESADASEGLRLVDRTSDNGAIEKQRTQGWASTASTAQRKEQQQHPPRFADELRPLRTPLRTKRSKRCRACRHILVKPEPKIQSVRFRIRLIAVNYIPTILLKPLQPPPSTQIPLTDLNALPTLRPIQFLLTLKNPLFDPVHVTLATQSHTLGKHSHKVTILCPQFDIGANVDQWDEALGQRGNRTSRLLNMNSVEYAGSANEGGKMAEAGKVWDQERNWTTVVVEVVCASVGSSGEGEEMEEDEDVLEIPVLVRMEWEADVERSEVGKTVEGKEKRELAYWSVIGVGKVERGELEAS